MVASGINALLSAFKSPLLCTNAHPSREHVPASAHVKTSLSTSHLYPSHRPSPSFCNFWEHTRIFAVKYVHLFLSTCAVDTNVASFWPKISSSKAAIQALEMNIIVTSPEDFDTKWPILHKIESDNHCVCLSSHDAPCISPLQSSCDQYVSHLHCRFKRRI